MIPRYILEQVFPGNVRAIREFEAQSDMVKSLARQSSAAGTENSADATYITASPNTQLPNERVLTVGEGLSVVDTDGIFRIDTTNELVKSGNGFQVVFASTAPAIILVPPSGKMATTGNIETLTNKTLDAPKFSSLGNYANDAAAAAGGVPINGGYLNGSVFMVRVA